MLLSTRYCQTQSVSLQDTFIGKITYEITTNLEADGTAQFSEITKQVEGCFEAVYYVRGNKELYRQLRKCASDIISISKYTVDSSLAYFPASNSIINFTEVALDDSTEKFLHRKGDGVVSLGEFQGRVYDYVDRENGEFGEEAYSKDMAYVLPFSVKQASRFGLPFTEHGLLVHSKLRSEIAKDKYIVNTTKLTKIQYDTTIIIAPFEIYFQGHLVEDYQSESILSPSIWPGIVPASQRIQFNPEIYNESKSNESLAKFRGSVVYIDVWASWCVPCIAAFDETKELLQYGESENFEVVGISIDRLEDWSEWRDVINKHNLSWNQYILPEQLLSIQTEGLDINSIPRYLILDKNGRLAVMDAPHPGDPNLQELLHMLILE